MPKQEVRVNIERLLDDAVERGVGYGFMHTIKHMEGLVISDSQEYHIKEGVREAVMSELYDVIRFPSFDEDEIADIVKRELEKYHDEEARLRELERTAEGRSTADTETLRAPQVLQAHCE